ncbi:hypothetical protein GCM10026915_14620 [Simiduia litorea]
MKSVRIYKRFANDLAQAMAEIPFGSGKGSGGMKKGAMIKTSLSLYLCSYIHQSQLKKSALPVLKLSVEFYV